MPDFVGRRLQATGAKVMAACAPRLANSHLELGGKSGLVVFDGVDLDAAVKTTMKGFLTNGGQICTAHTRLIVHEDIKEALLAKLKAKLEALPFADNPIGETDRGDQAWEEGWPELIQPVVCESQFVKINAFLAAAAVAGVTTLTGGASPEKRGYYVHPTVFVDVDVDGGLWQREIFGPVLVVKSFKTEAEAVRLMNNTKFGLASTVMCADPAKARRVANQVRAGAVYCTSTGFGILFEFPNVQRGGYGMSGVGRELGLHGLQAYTELKSVNFSGFSAADAGASGPSSPAKEPARSAPAPAPAPGPAGSSFTAGFVLGGLLAGALVAVVLIKPGCPAV